MRRLAGIALVALVGCDGPEGAAPDAAIDAVRFDARDRCTRVGNAGPGYPEQVAAVDASLVPFMTTGTTPDGSLDAIRYLRIGFLTGFCQTGYYLMMYGADGSGPVVGIRIPVPITELSPGLVAANAWLYSDPECTRTEQVRFQVVQLDVPPDDSPPPLFLRIAGRVLVNDGAWNLDFAVDATTEYINCI